MVIIACVSHQLSVMGMRTQYAAGLDRQVRVKGNPLRVRVRERFEQGQVFGSSRDETLERLLSISKGTHVKGTATYCRKMRKLPSKILKVSKICTYLTNPRTYFFLKWTSE